MIIMVIKLVLIPVTWFLIRMFSPCTKERKKSRLSRFHNYLVSNTIYSGLIALSYEAFLENSIAGYLGIRMPLL